MDAPVSSFITGLGKMIFDPAYISFIAGMITLALCTMGANYVRDLFSAALAEYKSFRNDLRRIRNAGEIIQNVVDDVDTKTDFTMNEEPSRTPWFKSAELGRVLVQFGSSLVVSALLPLARQWLANRQRTEVRVDPGISLWPRAKYQCPINNNMPPLDDILKRHIRPNGQQCKANDEPLRECSISQVKQEPAAQMQGFPAAIIPVLEVVNSLIQQKDEKQNSDPLMDIIRSWQTGALSEENSCTPKSDPNNNNKEETPTSNLMSNLPKVAESISEYIEQKGIDVNTLMSGWQKNYSPIGLILLDAFNKESLSKEEMQDLIVKILKTAQVIDAAENGTEQKNTENKEEESPDQTDQVIFKFLAKAQPETKPDLSKLDFFNVTDDESSSSSDSDEH